jgi:cell filamentation protein
VTDDPYVFPGTDVLKNLRGLGDPDALRRFEAHVVRLRELELRQRSAAPPFDLPRLQRIHGSLFQDVYEWAGELRTVTISKAGVPFAAPAHIVQEADRLFGELRRADHLLGLPRETFVDRLAYFLGEVNALHPFREGNGRAQRELFRQVALYAGWTLDFDAMDPDENIEASIEATLRSRGPAVLRRATSTARPPTRAADRGPHGAVWRLWNDCTATGAPGTRATVGSIPPA